MKVKSYKCPFCHGRVSREKVTLDLWIKGKLVVIEDVPADVCEICGEEAFAPQTSKKIDQLIKREKKPRAQTLVPIFSYA